MQRALQTCITLNGHTRTLTFAHSFFLSLSRSHTHKLVSLHIHNSTRSLSIHLCVWVFAFFSIKTVFTQVSCITCTAIESTEWIFVCKFDSIKRQSLCSAQANAFPNFIRIKDLGFFFRFRFTIKTHLKSIKCAKMKKATESTQRLSEDNKMKRNKKNLHTISYKQRTTNESQHTKKKTAVNDFF